MIHSYLSLFIIFSIFGKSASFDVFKDELLKALPQNPKKRAKNIIASALCFSHKEKLIQFKHSKKLIQSLSEITLDFREIPLKPWK